MDIIKVVKPWGFFMQFGAGASSTVKVIHVSPGHGLSLQSHRHRDEFWTVLEGRPTITLGRRTAEYAPGSEVRIPKCERHRLVNATDSEVRILEISTGKFDEDDIVRYEDRYGRVK
jgi:mannose-6-phosphate isomerase-like protein (cupin superfamily)